MSEVVEHANGAKTVIAHTLCRGRYDTDQEIDDSWYEEANVVLDELRVQGYVIVDAP